MSGFSRIPYYDGSRHNVRGYFLAKRLVAIESKAGGATPTVLDLTRDGHDGKVLLVSPSDTLLDILNHFRKGSHLALVTNDVEGVRECFEKGETIHADICMSGIVTLEDVIEQLLNTEIDDEEDMRIQREKMSQDQIEPLDSVVHVEPAVAMNATALALRALNYPDNDIRTIQRDVSKARATRARSLSRSNPEGGLYSERETNRSFTYTTRRGSRAASHQFSPVLPPIGTHDVGLASLPDIPRTSVPPSSVSLTRGVSRNNYGAMGKRNQPDESKNTASVNTKH
jgi:hypothetical protein